MCTWSQPCHFSTSRYWRRNHLCRCRGWKLHRLASTTSSASYSTWHCCVPWWFCLWREHLIGMFYTRLNTCKLWELYWRRVFTIGDPRCVGRLLLDERLMYFEQGLPTGLLIWLVAVQPEMLNAIWGAFGSKRLVWKMLRTHPSPRSLECVSQSVVRLLCGPECAWKTN